MQNHCEVKSGSMISMTTTLTMRNSPGAKARFWAISTCTES